MSSIKEGWVEKCGPKRCPTWNKRWLVLYDTRVLEYFRNDKKNDLKGVIELSGKETIKLAGDAGKTFDNGFYLETPARTYKFAVSSNREKTEWCDLIKQVINGHINIRMRTNKNANYKNKKRTGSTAISMKKTYSTAQQTYFKPRAHSSPMKPSLMNAMNIKATNDKKIITQLNENILIKIMHFLYMNKYEFNKFFVICKLFRQICINNEYFFRYYTINVYPQQILCRYTKSKNNPNPNPNRNHNRFILNHKYREIWIFGNVLDCMSDIYCTKLFLDDPMLWDCDENALKEMVCYISQEKIIKNIHFIHIRSYENESLFLKLLPYFSCVDSIQLDFTFDPQLFNTKINANNLIYLALHRVDLINDNDDNNNNNNNNNIRMCFKQLRRLLVLSIIDSRWKHSIVLPPQIKFFRFKPCDLSIVDMSRIADKSESKKNNLSYRVNWPCDMIVSHNNWPSVMNQYIMAGHEALQNKKLRIWVLRHLRKWDKVLMNVNYCQYPPPFQLFKKSKCFKKLLYLDQHLDMNHIWTSKKSKYWRHEPL